MEDELICSQWPRCTGQTLVPGLWAQRGGSRCTVAGGGEGAVAAGVGLAARTELRARAGTVITRPLTIPFPPGEGVSSSHSPSPPSSAGPPQGGARCVPGTRGLDAPLSVSRRGLAALPRRTQPAVWPLEAGEHPSPLALESPTQTSGPHVPRSRAESCPPPPCGVLTGVHSPDGPERWVSLPAPLPILFSPHFLQRQKWPGVGSLGPAASKGA